MHSTIDIRKCTVSDAALLADVGAATFVETFGHLYRTQDLDAFLIDSRSEQSYAKTLQDPKVLAWLALDAQSRAIGYVLAGACKLPVQNLEPSAGEIRELYVRAEAQGQQIGSRLLAVALDGLRSAGHKPLYIGVWSENLGAQRLYRRQGFEKVGEYDFPVGEQMDREFILKSPR